MSNESHKSSPEARSPKPEAISERPPPVVCRLLRTKSAFGSEQHASWQRGDSNTDVFWCLNTMETFGPDDGFVHAHECRKGRACFQVPAEHDDDPVTS